jgi:Rrf2 family protein
MKFSALEEYGLRCILQMAKQGSDEVTTIQDLAEKEAITPAYVAKLMRILRKAKLVQSIRGQQGGYQLARAADQITIYQVLIALGGPLYSGDYCHQYPGVVHVCVRSVDCSIRSLWEGVNHLFAQALSNCKLTDLLVGEIKMNQWIKTNWPETPKEISDPSRNNRVIHSSTRTRSSSKMHSGLSKDQA